MVSVDDASVMRPELAAVLPLLEQLTKDPESVVPADIDAVREAGVPGEAIVEALHVIHRVSYRLPRFTVR